MNITDLENTPPTIDPTPRPHMGRRPLAEDHPARSTQEIAAARRRPSVDVPYHYKVVAVAVVAILAISGIAIAVNSSPASALRPELVEGPRPLATAEPSLEVAVAAQAPFSAHPVAAATEEPVIDAYAAPDGALLGPVEISRANAARPVAHCRADWIQADVDGSGLVWLPRPNVTLAMVGPDLCAQPEVAPMTGRGNGPAPVAQPAQLIIEQRPVAQPAQAETVEKPAADRADRRATAIAKLQRPPSDRDTMSKGSK